MATPNNYKAYISGLKGFACIMVMIGHYIGLYKYAENFPVNSKVLSYFDLFLESKINFVLSESFWVILFFFVSGYLVSQSRIQNIKDLLSKSVMRFLRLGLPILFACLIIYLLSETIGFYTLSTKGLLENEFIQGCYTGEFSFWSVLTSPIDVLIFNNTAFCGPYWVLREMFITSLIIYLLSYLDTKINNKTVFILLLMAVFFGSMFISHVVFSGVFGMIVAVVEKDENREYITNSVFAFSVICFCLVLLKIPHILLANTLLTV